MEAHECNLYIHRTLILSPNFVPEKVGVNQKWYFHQKQGVSLIKRSQRNGFKSKMKERKLKSGVNWPGELKQKGIQQMNVKCIISMYRKHKHYKQVHLCLLPSYFQWFCPTDNFISKLFQLVHRKLSQIYNLSLSLSAPHSSAHVNSFRSVISFPSTTIIATTLQTKAKTTAFLAEQGNTKRTFNVTMSHRHCT